jgi:hypothetical protein
MRDDHGEGQEDEGEGEIEGYVVVQDGKPVLVSSSTVDRDKVQRCLKY